MKTDTGAGGNAGVQPEISEPEALAEDAAGQPPMQWALTRLVAAGLADFDALWHLDANWVKPPDFRTEDWHTEGWRTEGLHAGGWAGVSRIAVDDGRGGQLPLFLKRQENRRYLSLRRPLGYRPILEREFFSSRALQRAEVPAVEAVFFTIGRGVDRSRAVLVTQALEGFASLASLAGTITETERRIAVLRAVAGLLARLHSLGFRHGALFDRHILAREIGDEVDVRLIDLARTRSGGRLRGNAVRDMDQLLRNMPGWTRDETNWLVHCYLEAAHWMADSEDFQTQLQRRVDIKLSRKLGL